MADDKQIPAPDPERAPRSVGFLLSQLGFFAAGNFAEALKPVGISPPEFLLLRFVDAKAGQAQNALAERLAVPPSRMVALVDSLEERGLIERRTDAKDRRVRTLHLTDQGMACLGKASEVALDYERDLCAPLEEGERDALIDLLQKLAAGQTDLGGVHPGLRRIAD